MQIMSSIPFMDTTCLSILGCESFCLEKMSVQIFRSVTMLLSKSLVLVTVMWLVDQALSWPISLLVPRSPIEEVIRQKTDFCAYVMSNVTNSADERSRIFELLSAYKSVNSGGRWRNNVGGPVPDKLAFQSSHKFVIAFENCSYPGYITEKFAEAAASNAIPIYWGDPQIASFFNHKAFVNCHDFPNLQSAVERVIEIDNDNRCTNKARPWFPQALEPSC